MPGRRVMRRADQMRGPARAAAGGCVVGAGRTDPIEGRVDLEGRALRVQLHVKLEAPAPRRHLAALVEAA
eukprot:903212-Prymnesium_polylepis.1